MDNSRSKLLGRVKDQWEVDYIRQNVEIHKTSGICIGTTKTGIDLPAGQHIHESFEFIIPVSGDVAAKSGKKVSVIEHNRIFGYNTGQSHGMAVPVEKSKFLSITIERNYLWELCHEISGRSEIYFNNGNYSLSSDLKTLICSFIDECRNPQTGSGFILQNLRNLIAMQIIRTVGNNMPEAESVKRHGKQNIERAAEYLREHSIVEFSLEDASKEAELSPYHFIRIFKLHTGKTPYEYFIDKKVEKAKEMLASRRLSITEVCFSCGFNNHSHFTSIFKKKVGITPSEYRKIACGIF